MTTGPDLATGRLPAAALNDNFGDAHPPLDKRQAVIEANRCYFCYDAPCIEACPTGIDIPAFIKSIGTGNTRGAATTILDSNIMGGMCARVCPVEELCEEACVRNTAEDKPVNIGALQRFATDHLFDALDAGRTAHPFTRQPETGRRVAVVGAGPAGLSCAHRLALLGHTVTVFEARDKAGGLNEYGIAAYKTPQDFAQREVDFTLSIGGITLETGTALGRELSLASLRAEFDAVFLGVGHTAVRALRAEGEDFAGVENAVDYIARLRQATDKAALPVGRRVVVIGGGNTAIDIATQVKRLGAEDVTLVYRRGPDAMSATWKEQAWAQTNGVRIKHWAQPRRLLGWPAAGSDATAVKEVEFEYTQLDADGRLMGTGDTFTLLADQVFKAIGQVFMPGEMLGADLLELDGDRIVVNADGETSLPGVYAGGDCTPGVDLTVQAVEDGKVAAMAIDRRLRGTEADVPGGTGADVPGGTAAEGSGEPAATVAQTAAE